ncbi:helix-turn-helix domain-containing protein [Dielma fastidiosa]|uniref:helix-turn-helix domain-containing protein n=1 Tax=Dielma fastidiosa TaxID=1034346 RepID=UPI000E47D386|nr:helix-turn-helix transcriptional regulator [Dielma fastidiosa]RHN01287.1 XRE family transcriptional regulator [Dielma fastidiosa]
MKKHYGKYLSYIIKSERKKQELSQDQLSALCNISKSYLSKIENADDFSNEYIIEILLNKLGIHFIYDMDELSELDCLLDEFYYSQVYYNDNANDNYLKVLSYKNDYINSILITKFLVYTYAWLVTHNQSVDDIESKLENELFNYLPPSNELMQIYLDYKGVHQKNNSNFEEAICLFKKALKLGANKNSYAMICYHLATTLMMSSNYLEALHYNETALEYFIKEFNYKRQLFAQVYIAVIYSYCALYDKAEDIYQNLLLNPHCSNDALLWNTIRSNSAWNMCLQHKYNEALNILFPDGEKNELLFAEEYFNVAWCYYRLNQYAPALKWIDRGLKVSFDVYQTKVKLKTIQALIQNKDDIQAIYHYLIKEYHEIKDNLSQENKRFYLELLVEFCEKAYKYKEALHYYRLLVNKY